MLFFSKDKKAKTTAPQRPTIMRSALRIAFNPEIGASVRPLQESVDVFVNLLAMIFISQKMFPANHPAYLGTGGARLSLRLLLATVWHNLRFSKETVPQVLLFFAVVSSFVFAGLALIVFMFSLFVGKAHAQGYFNPPSGGDDIAQQWIDFLFKGQVSGDFITDYAQPIMQAWAIQGALVTALGFYSDAILIVAAVILFYHLAAMTVETAHHGVVMGKQANQIWAPIRLVVAIGLLVPIGGGLNSGQYIVVKITEWGSGLASNVWGLFLGGLATDLSLQGVPFVPQYARDVVYNTLMSEACRAAYDSYDNKGQNSIAQKDQQASNPTKDATANSGKIDTSDIAQQKPEVRDARRCGHHTFNKTAKPGNDQTDAATQGAVQSNAQSCYMMMQQEAQQYATQEASYHTDDDVGGKKSQQTPPYDGQFENLVSDYMGCLAGGLPIPMLLGVFAQSADWGWVSAGAALSAVAQAEADANDISALIPETQAPDFSGDGGDPVMRDKVAPIVDSVAKHISMLPEGGGGGGGGSIGQDSCAAQRGILMQQASGMAQAGNAKDHFLDRIFELIDWLAAWNCVWTSGPVGEGETGNFALGIQFTGANPLAEMAALGQAMINTAYDSFDIYVNLAATAGKENAGNSAIAATGPKSAVSRLPIEGYQGALSAVGGILGIITAVFFTAGVMLAYFLPLIPFIRFLFNVLTWVISVLEAIICMPLLALAHLNPNGEGLPGPSAKQGYFFVFNIFLRPVLMVFGLIVGLLVFYIAVSYMNLFYAMAISTSGGLASAHLVLSRLIYSALYVIILYMCANSAFKCIEWLPDHALRWMAATPMHFHGMGDPQQVSGVLQQGVGNISGINQAVQGGGFGAAQMLGGGGGLQNGATLGSVVAGQQGQIRGGGQQPSLGAGNTQSEGNKADTNQPPQQQLPKPSDDPKNSPPKKPGDNGR